MSKPLITHPSSTQPDRSTLSVLFVLDESAEQEALLRIGLRIHLASFSNILAILQGGAPKIAKLVYNYNN